MLDTISSYLTPDAAIVTGAAILIELVFRLVKSKKPLSIAHGVAAGARKVSDLCSKLADLLDKVLPQKLK